MMKYLEVMLDQKLIFWKQAKRVSDKARNVIMALKRLMPNIGGPSSSRERLLITTVEFIIQIS